MLSKEEILLIRKWIKSPVSWVESMFGLVPQPLKEGYVVGVNTNLESIKADWFLPFEKGKHLTWQQWVVLLAVERGLLGGKRFLSVASGHGTGKSAVMAMILLWFLSNYENSQIPCTAPTVSQMYDVLWKEVSLWHSRLPENFRNNIEVQSSYVRVKSNPMAWFARAATARKENPEALAGIHSDNTMLLVDEGSAVPEEIFITGEGALTNKNAFFIIFSNYTRLNGYFHRSQINEFDEWQTLQFSSAESPIVEKGFVERMARRGLDSNEYRVRVLGKPPKQDEEIKGYVPLLQKSDLRFTLMNEMTKPTILGIDPSGEGRNKSAFVVRDAFRALPVGVYRDMKAPQMAQHTLQLMEEYKILPENVVVDGFGVGMELINEFQKLRVPIMGVLVGSPADDPAKFVNKKAEMYGRLREWILKGAELVGTYKQWEEILGIRYCSEMSKVKIMSKKMMMDNGMVSPDLVEGLMLTFLHESYATGEEEKEEIHEEPFDSFYGI
jgi:hypothetical protein